MCDVRRVRFACLMLAVVTMCGVGVARAQTAPPAKPRLSLSIGSGAPESETELTLKLAAPAGMAVGRIEAEVTFQVEALRFDRVAGYLVSEKFLKADTKLGAPNLGKQTLVISFQSAKPGQPIPNDMQVDLVFTVAKGTKPGVLDVGLQAKVFAPDSAPFASVEVYDGRINIQEAEVFYSCFFYMH